MTPKEQDLRFGKFGTVSFTKITKVNAFIDHLGNGKLMYTQCKPCGEIYFPPRADCSACLASDMQWLEVTGRGKLVSFSRLTYPPVGFEDDLPYAIALVDYGPYRIFGRLDHDLDIDEVKIGMALIARSSKLPEGQLSYCFDRPT
jgi:uncharacterized OB-fold protein